MLLNEIRHKRPVEDDDEYGMDNGRYVGIKFTPETQEMLKRIVHDEQIPNGTPSDKMHTTVMYSKDNPVPDYQVAGKLDEPIEAEIDDFDYFDTDEGKCLVAKLQSDNLVDRHNTARSLGASYDYDEYIPHVTLSYNASDLDDSFLDKLRSKYKGKKVYGAEEYDEPIQRDWAKNNT